MKRIFLALGLVAGLGFSSCNGFLDKEPTTSLPVDGAVTTFEDLENAINGVSYLLTVNRMSYGSEFSIYADLLTNNYKVIKDNGQSSPISRYTLTKTDELATTAYQLMYKALANVNKALESSLAVEDDGVEDQRGQLYAWRAMLHFDLARLYAHIPSTVSNTGEANSGIVISNQVFEPEYLPTRASLADTYTMIVSDFTEAIHLLDEVNATGYMTKWAAMALRARAYLYMGKYAEALADAKAVIASGRYKLYTRDEYAGVWDDQGTAESIFELLITTSYNSQRNSMGYYMNPDGYAEMGFNTDGALYKYLDANKDTDIRYELVADYTDYKESRGYYPGKYPGRESLYVNNPKIIRLSEVYLIAAEAAFYLNDVPAAAGFINEIEKNRVKDYKDVSSVTIDDILFEYDKELFAEGHSAFAYWRNKKSVTNQNGKEIAYNNERTILPIPQREINMNSALVQNPGY